MALGRIPIGPLRVYRGRPGAPNDSFIERNRRVRNGSVILRDGIDVLENTERPGAHVYCECPITPRYLLRDVV
jgi:hypothetical protein